MREEDSGEATEDGAGEEMPCGGTEWSGGRDVVNKSWVTGAPSGMVWYKMPFAVARLRCCSPSSKGEDGRESGAVGEVTGAE